MSATPEHFLRTMRADESWVAEHQLLSRVAERANDIARSIVDRYRRDIIDYANLSHVTLAEDVLPNATLTIKDMLRRIQQRTEPTEQEVDDIRRAASRRVHQEVSLPSLLHTYRIWGAVVWHEIAQEAERDPALAPAALRLVEPVMDYVNQVSIWVSQVYLEESSGLLRGRDIMRTDLLESLLVGRALSDRARLDISRLRIADDNRLVVVLVRLLDVPTDRVRPDSARAIRALRDVGRRAGLTSMGVRDADVVAICRLGDAVGAGDVEAAAGELATVDPGWRVAVGRAHQGTGGIARSFKEAQEAAAAAATRTVRGTATLFSDVMLDRILLNSEYAQDLLAETTGPLTEYDRRHSASMVDTLRAYIAADFNVSRTAKALTVNANTVAYRLRRIAAITGHDPATSSGVTTFAIALRLHDG